MLCKSYFQRQLDDYIQKCEGLCENCTEKCEDGVTEWYIPWSPELSEILWKILKGE